MKIQPPKGTRDFYPPEMAMRRWLEDHWRAAAIRNGFEEIEGPVFESLDLYKVKSGAGIVSELFHFQDRGERELAIRPEFTPTLARMAAEKSNSLPRPIKWFCIPNLCRAERPQRGRLREFLQWNVDLLGLEGPAADAEVIFTAVDFLKSLKLTPAQVRVKISHRDVVKKILQRLGVQPGSLLEAFDLLDRRDKLPPEEFARLAGGLGLSEAALAGFNQVARVCHPADAPWQKMAEHVGVPAEDLEDLRQLSEALENFDIANWCEYDLGIVRGLAYYTGTVFEIHEASGAERAIAGGGRYDQLIEMFGGPATPAMGFGMGDVVLSLVLQDQGLLPLNPAPAADVFVLVADEQARPFLHRVVAGLRQAGLHTRFSYKTSTKLGKGLKEADQCRARFAVILDARSCTESLAGLKNMAAGDQQDIPLDRLAECILASKA